VAVSVAGSVVDEEWIVIVMAEVEVEDAEDTQEGTDTEAVDAIVVTHPHLEIDTAVAVAG